MGLSVVFQFARGDHPRGAAERADEFPLFPQRAPTDRAAQAMPPKYARIGLGAVT